MPLHEIFALTHRVIERGVIRLGYRLEGGVPLDLEETMTLPRGLAGDPGSPAVARALEALHVACGTSYWKACVPPRIRIEGPGLPEAEAAFWTRAWTHGLGEFFFRNDLSPRDRVAFPGDAVERPSVAPDIPADGAPLLLVGGGKDSVVSAEILRAAGVTPRLFCLGRSKWIDRAAAAIGGELLVMERAIAPGLLELNAAGALNGHVPISAIISFAARIVALLSGASAVIASNERSASIGNAIVDGFEVNHQWSKGLAYERLVRAWEDRNTPGGPRYFSLLRPMSELAIGREFARHPRYFDAITSCNRNFALRPAAGTPRWCGTCPKCVFVFLMIAPWQDDDGLARIFGRIFIDDPATLPVVEELAGLAGTKPFECVGEPDEVVAALWLLHESGCFAETPALRAFRARILPALASPRALVDDVLRPSPDHAIPPPWSRILDAHLRSR